MQTSDHRVRVVTDEHAVDACLRTLPADFVRGPFQKQPWIDAWLAVREPARRRVVLATVTSGAGALRFVLPLTLTVRSRVPCWTALDDGVADYNAPLFAPDFRPSAATMRRIWREIRDGLPDGDLVLLEKMPETVAGHHNPLLDVDRPIPSRFFRHPLSLCAGIEAVRARFAGTRSLDRKRRKLQRRGSFEFEVLTGEDAAPLLDRLMTWREARYDARPITSALYRRLLTDSDIARLGLLRLDGEPIAGCFTLVADGALRLLVVGHDRRFNNWSPGLLVIEDMIAWAAATGLGEFDFTIGSEAYKFDFGVATERLWDLRAALRLRGTLMSAVLHLRRWAASLARRPLRSAEHRATQRAGTAGIGHVSRELNGERNHLFSRPG